MTRLLCVITLVTACGGRPGASAHHAAPPHGASGSATATTAVADEPSGARSGDRSVDDCGKLVDHALALGDAERPAEHQLTGDERARLTAQLRTSWAAACKAMTTRGYQCALTARSLVELDACGG